MHLAQEKEWLLKEKYNGVESKAFFTDLARLEKGEPLAYIIGYVPFLGTTVYLDSKPLIPRAETEFWVEKAIQEIQKGTPETHILDLCAGSGCIGVAILFYVQDARVDFVEIDTRHHPTIEKNIVKNNRDQARAHIIGGDLFGQVTKKYSYILTNPPYIDQAQTNRMQKSVREYEPERALFGGEDGMEYIARIVASAPQYLTENGVLYTEHEPEQTKAIASLGKKAGFRQIATHKDQFGTERFSRLEI